MTCRKTSLCSWLCPVIPYPTKAFTRQELQCSLFSVPFIVYRNSSGFCSLCCHHVARYLFMHWKLIEKTKACFPLFLSFICCWPATHCQERDGSLESPVALESFPLLILSCPLFSKTAENPACHDSRVLPNSKRHRSCWAFDNVGHFQLHGKASPSGNQKLVSRRIKTSTKHFFFNLWWRKIAIIW